MKIFPAVSVGGPAHIRALRSVFPDVAFCPTGGVEPGNVAAYLSAGAAFVGMGGALVDESRIAAGDRAAIEAAARQVLDVRLCQPSCSAWASRCWSSTSSRPSRTARRLYLEGHAAATPRTRRLPLPGRARVSGYITTLGRDFAGDSFMALWAEEGVDASTVARSERHPTGVYFVFHGPRGHSNSCITGRTRRRRPILPDGPPA